MGQPPSQPHTKYKQLQLALAALIAFAYAAALNARTFIIKLGPFRRSNTGGSQRPPRGSPTRVEATGPAQEAISNTTSRSKNQARNHKPAGSMVRAAPRSRRALKARGDQTENNQVTQLLTLLRKQNYLLTTLLLLSSIQFLLPIVAAQEQIIVFDEIGQMAASTAYIHVAIPLNISTYQHQVTIFENFLQSLTTKTTDDPHTVSFTKAIRDLATFAFKRLDKLAEKLRFIDIVLTEDTFEADLNPRQKRFFEEAFCPSCGVASGYRYANASILADDFDPFCDLKTNQTATIESIEQKLAILHTTQYAYLLPLYPLFRKSKRVKRQLIRGFMQGTVQRLEPLRRRELLLCHLRKNHQTTTPLPYPDYPEFHAIFQNDTHPTTTTTTTPQPSHQVFSNHTTLPPPDPFRLSYKRSIPDSTDENFDIDFDSNDNDVDTTNNNREPRQIIAGIAAVGGVLGTIFGLFNQLEMHNIEKHVSKLESSQNMLIQVAHTNTQNINALKAEINHLDIIIETLIKYNPALVYAKLMSQVDDVADHLDALLDTVQQLQHQKLSIKLLSLHQLHILFKSLQKSAAENDWTLLIRTPQDIFQLDVSYIRKNADVIIMVHVPCLTDNFLLTIYRYANLPLPVNTLLITPQTNDTLTHLQPIHTISDLVSQFSHPMSRNPAQEALHLIPETDLIAIGRNDGSSHRYKLLSHADLAACIQRNHVFLCEGHQVLRTDLEGSCLGSIYLQSERGVRENCEIQRKLLRETVFQISATDHLVVSPNPHTAQVTCKNGSHHPVRIRTTSRIHINPGCTLKLFNHTLRSDQSIRIKPEPLLFPWDFNPLILPSELMNQAQHLDDQVNRLKSTIITMQNVTVQDHEIPDAITETLTDSVSTFSVLFWSTFSIAILSLGLLTCWYCGSRRRQQSRTKLRSDELPMTISQIAEMNLPGPDE